MPKHANTLAVPGNRHRLDLAKVLLVHSELAPRLALQTILQAGGYSVDAAATPAEAIAKLDSGCYDLVLTDAGPGGNAAGNLLAYARVKEYRPATAMVRSFEPTLKRNTRHRVAIHTENLPSLLAKVAELIGVRAIRRYRPLRHAAS
jgi:CheY-like chemotaxis protein